MPVRTGKPAADQSIAARTASAGPASQLYPAIELRSRNNHTRSSASPPACSAARAATPDASPRPRAALEAPGAGDAMAQHSCRCAWPRAAVFQRLLIHSSADRRRKHSSGIKLGCGSPNHPLRHATCYADRKHAARRQLAGCNARNAGPYSHNSPRARQHGCLFKKPIVSFGLPMVGFCYRFRYPAAHLERLRLCRGAHPPAAVVNDRRFMCWLAHYIYCYRQ